MKVRVEEIAFWFAGGLSFEIIVSVHSVGSKDRLLYCPHTGITCRHRFVLDASMEVNDSSTSRVLVDRLDGYHTCSSYLFIGPK